MSEVTPDWYEDGLAFSCRGCGQCCRGPGGYVWITETEVKTLAAALGLDLDSFGKRYLRRSGSRLSLVDNANGDCVFLEGKGRCAVYDMRPVQCRTYPWWPELLETPDAWDREKRHCPGLGQGERHPVESIRTGIKKAQTVD